MGADACVFLIHGLVYCLSGERYGDQALFVLVESYQ